MILHDKTKDEFNIEFDTSGVWNKFYCKCDYCDVIFLRSKRNIIAGSNVINKQSCNSKECVKAKREESQMTLYGVKNAGGTEDSRGKSKQTFLEKYGVDNATKSPEVKEKIKQTNLERYGKTSYLGTKECHEIAKQKTMEKYGVEYYAQTDECKEKMRQTCLENYGVEYYSQTNERNELVKQTCMEKYGVEYYAQTEDGKNKMKQTLYERYGVEHALQLKEFRMKAQKTMLERHGVLHANRFGKTQTEIGEWLNSLGFNFKSNYEILDGKEIDLYDESIKLGIEYCGLFWHNELSPSPKSKSYHHDKYIKCSKKGIHLITIFEDEWLYRKCQCQNVIKSILGKYEQRIYARSCNVSIIDKTTSNAFYDKHHILGKGKTIISFGIFKDGNLLGVMSMGRHHRQNQKSIVLNRMCFADNTQIIGGASRLFSRCVEWAKENKHENIISWSDNRWFSGKSYEKMEFELEEELPPDYSYVNIHKIERKSKQSMKKNKSLLGTEKEQAESLGFARIWDCGKKRWALTI